MKHNKITYVIPCYNEEMVLPELYRRLCLESEKHNTYEFEYIFVNDGSTDSTERLLDEIAASDKRAKVLHLANNRGHQEALTAGIDFSNGDITILIDADLQDPPELVGEIIKKVNEGFELIHMQRRTRRGDSPFKLFTAKIYYAFMARFAKADLIDDCGDFKAFTRPVLKAVQSFRERHRYLRGIFSMLGFRQCVIQYDRDERFAGKTKYSLRKMIGLALDGILSFSSGPIKLLTWTSLLLWTASLIYLVKSLIEHFILKIAVSGWTSIIILMTFFTGIIVFGLAMISAYIARIFEQGQNRPIYWLRAARNIDIDNIDNKSPEVRLAQDSLDN